MKTKIITMTNHKLHLIYLIVVLGCVGCWALGLYQGTTFFGHETEADYYKQAMLIYCEIAQTQNDILIPEIVKYNITVPKIEPCENMLLSWDKEQ